MLLASFMVVEARCEGELLVGLGIWVIYLDIKKCLLSNYPKVPGSNRH